MIKFIIILDSSTAYFTGLEAFDIVFTKEKSIKFYMYGDIKVIYIYEQSETELIETINNLREDLLYMDFSDAEKIE